MAYVEYKYVFDDSIEYEYRFCGHYGQKGEKRAPRSRPSTEQMKRQNQWSRQKHLRRKVKLNFKEGDPLITLKYKAGAKPPLEEIEKDFKKFRDRLRREYKKRGLPLKYIYRMEIGKRGSPHIHVLANYTEDILKLIRKCWEPGQANIEATYDLENGELADYLSKPPDEEIEARLEELPEGERKKFVRFSCSRNLENPEPEKRIYSHRTVAKKIRDGIEPTPGFYVDKETVRYGINPFSGFSYLYYTERRGNCAGARERPVWKEEVPW